MKITCFSPIVIKKGAQAMLLVLPFYAYISFIKALIMPTHFSLPILEESMHRS